MAFESAALALGAAGSSAAVAGLDVVAEEEVEVAFASEAGDAASAGPGPLLAGALGDWSPPLPELEGFGFGGGLCEPLSSALVFADLKTVNRSTTPGSSAGFAGALDRMMDACAAL